MNHFLSGSALTLSLSAFALSGFALFKATTAQVPVIVQSDCPAPRSSSPTVPDEPLW